MHRLKVGPEIGSEAQNFPVDFPDSGNFLETIPAQTATTAMQSADQRL